MPTREQRQRDKQRQAENPPSVLGRENEVERIGEGGDDEDQEMDSVFSDFPQNENCIELWHVLPQGGHPKFLEELAPIMFSFAYVAEKYGGGRYIAKGKYKDGSYTKKRFEVEGESIPVKRRIPQAAAPVVGAQPFFPVPVPGSERGSGEGNVSELQAMMVTMMNTMMQQMKGSENEFLDKMVKYKALFGAPEHKEAPIETALNMFQKGVELAGMNQSGDGGIPWMMILKEMKEPLMKLADTVNYALAPKKPMMVNQPAPGAPGVLPQGGGSVEPSPSPEPLKGESDMIMMFVRSVLPALINGAARNADPANYVDFLLDQVPTGSYDSLRVWLMAPDCLDKLAVVEPGIRFQQEWWVSLRSGLIDALNEELGHAVRSLHPEPNTDPSTGSPADSPILP